MSLIVAAIGGNALKAEDGAGAAGEFPPGTMGPKVEAAVEFVERGGGVAVITSLDRIAAAAAGTAGTRITL